jgi:hypothetical protein
LSHAKLLLKNYAPFFVLTVFVVAAAFVTGFAAGFLPTVGFLAPADFFAAAGFFIATGFVSPSVSTDDSTCGTAATSEGAIREPKIRVM